MLVAVRHDKKSSDVRSAATAGSVGVQFPCILCCAVRCARGGGANASIANECEVVANDAVVAR